MPFFFASHWNCRTQQQQKPCSQICFHQDESDTNSWRFCSGNALSCVVQAFETRSECDYLSDPGVMFHFKKPFCYKRGLTASPSVNCLSLAWQQPGVTNWQKCFSFLPTLIRKANIFKGVVRSSMDG